MSGYSATTTFGSVGTGVVTLTPGFKSSSVSVDVSPAVGAAFQGIQFCTGWTDGIRKKCDSIYANLSNGMSKSEKSTSKLVRLFSDDGDGNIVVVLEATLNSITATQVKFDVTVANTAYQVSIKCES